MFKRSYLASLAIILVAPVVVGAVVTAQTDSNTGTTTNTTISPDKPSEQQTTAPKPEEVKAAREARIKKQKETLKVKLGAAEKKKIQEKCKAAQGKTSSVSGRINGLETSRAQVHVNMFNRLDKLTVKLEARGADTTQLKAELTVLAGKVDKFHADLAIYKQSVQDLEALECATDPEGFKAALLTARTNLETVKADAKDVQTFLKETIKPLLKSIRSQLGGTPTAPAEGDAATPTQTPAEGGAQ